MVDSGVLSDTGGAPSTSTSPSGPDLQVTFAATTTTEVETDLGGYGGDEEVCVVAAPAAEAPAAAAAAIEQQPIVPPLPQKRRNKKEHPPKGSTSSRKKNKQAREQTQQTQQHFPQSYELDRAEHPHALIRSMRDCGPSWGGDAIVGPLYGDRPADAYYNQACTREWWWCVRPRRRGYRSGRSDERCRGS